MESLRDSTIAHCGHEPGRDALPRVRADRQVGLTTAVVLGAGTSNSHYGPVTPRRVRAPGLHPPQNQHLVGRVPSPGVPISSIMRIAEPGLGFGRVSLLTPAEEVQGIGTLREWR